MRAVAVVLVLVSCACGSDGSSAADGGAIDAAPATDACVPYAERRCANGDLYWYDSCGTELELASECPLPSVCSTISNECCDPASSGTVARTNYPGQVDWTFAERGDSMTLTFDFSDVAEGYGMMFYASPTVGGSPMWIGPQTNLATGVPGLLVTRYRYCTSEPCGDGGAVDGPIAEEIEMTSPTAFTEGNGTSNFLGVRQPYPWAPGRYTISLVRGESAGGSKDWVDISITDPSGETLEVGRIKVARVLPAEPATFPSTFKTEMMVYNYAVNYGLPPQTPPSEIYENIPNWSFDVWYEIGGASPTAITSQYKIDEDGIRFDNFEIQGRPDSVFVAVGKDVGRCSPEGSLLEAP